MRAVRRIVLALLVLGAAGALGLLVGRPFAERRITALISQAAGAAGVTLGGVAFSWTGPLQLTDITVDRKDTGRVHIARADVRWDYAGGTDYRAHVRGFDLVDIKMKRGPLTLELGEAAYDVVSWEVREGVDHLRLRQRPNGGEVSTQWRSASLGGAREMGVDLKELDLGAARLRWGGDGQVQPGIVSGRLAATGSGAIWSSRADLSATGVRLGMPTALLERGAAAGAPVPLHLAWDAVGEGEAVSVRHLRARFGGLKVTGEGRISGAGAAATLEASLAAETELGAAFQATGLRLPASLAVPPTEPLGTAWFELAVKGPLARPAELLVTPTLRFASAPEGVKRLQFLRGPFPHRPSGSSHTIDVRDGAPDFIAIDQVPARFQRALLLSEDAGFYGHPGVDVAEIHAAWAVNVERGSFARGASTLTQQLVKNLFLSTEKSYGRKVEEAALALLVDAAVPKPRILEIYLNIIEWGPELYGLVPASRHYFGKSPTELSARETAFLICLIPSPVRYHQAHTADHVGPGMEQLMANLLAKLLSVGALTEDEYASALAEPLQFAPEPGALSARSGATP